MGNLQMDAAPHTLATIAQWADFDALIDARSPSEFALDHLPGAINCPVLDDAQRIQVGTLYKQVSPFEARKLGAVLVARNVAQHIETLFASQPKSWRPLVYCWRGGQRSGAFTHVLNEVGWSARRLQGGYKAWRHHVLDALLTLPTRLRWVVLAGPTGSGKTRVLQALQTLGVQVLDLEALAAHKGSVLGGMPGQPQPSQKMFETRLFHALAGLDPARPVVVEAESRRLGQLRLPDALYQAVQAGYWLGLEVPLHARVEFLLRDYAYLLYSPVLDAYLERLLPTCGRAQVQAWLDLRASGQYATLVHALLRGHYDVYYQRSMQQLHAAAQAGRVFAAPDVSDASVHDLALRIAHSLAQDR